MKLFTQFQHAKLLANGRASQEKEVDHFPVVKLFTPDANATWLLSEIDPIDTDRAFGLCDLGLGSPELGYVSIAELTALRGTLGLPVERDLQFEPKQTLTAYALEARSVYRIIA